MWLFTYSKTHGREVPAWRSFVREPWRRFLEARCAKLRDSRAIFVMGVHNHRWSSMMNGIAIDADDVDKVPSSAALTRCRTRLVPITWHRPRAPGPAASCQFQQSVLRKMAQDLCAGVPSRDSVPVCEGEVRTAMLAIPVLA